MQKLSNEVYEHVENYDGSDNPNPECGINSTVNANQQCKLSITVTQDLQPPVLIYYQIEGFHQNHRSYQRSRDVYQVSCSQDSSQCVEFQNLTSMLLHSWLGP